MRNSWYRIDPQPPDKWAWRSYPEARSRFDSASGRFRVRYAGDAQRVAMRERFDRDQRMVPLSALDAHLVELVGRIQVVDLRRDQTLDALGLDDQISTSRAPDVWAACHLLIDLVQEWFGERCDGVAYRSRTTPERSANLAFFKHSPLQARDLGLLRSNNQLLLDCATADGFHIRDLR